MYLQTVMEQADTDQQQHQQPAGSASSTGTSQDAAQHSRAQGSSAALPLAQAASQSDAYAKLKRLVSLDDSYIEMSAASYCCVPAGQSAWQLHTIAGSFILAATLLPHHLNESVAVYR